MHATLVIKTVLFFSCHTYYPRNGCVVMASFQPITRGKSETTFTESHFSRVSKTTRPITIRINKNSSSSHALTGFEGLQRIRIRVEESNRMKRYLVYFEGLQRIRIRDEESNRTKWYLVLPSVFKRTRLEAAVVNNLNWHKSYTGKN